MWFESLLVFILFIFKKCPNISGIRVVHFLQICWQIESSKEQHLFERETAFFEQFNVSLLNKSIHFLKNNKLLNGSVY